MKMLTHTLNHWIAKECTNMASDKYCKLCLQTVCGDYRIKCKVEIDVWLMEYERYCKTIDWDEVRRKAREYYNVLVWYDDPRYQHLIVENNNGVI